MRCDAIRVCVCVCLCVGLHVVCSDHPIRFGRCALDLVLLSPWNLSVAAPPLYVTPAKRHSLVHKGDPSFFLPLSASLFFFPRS
ncbi:hypothetical protein M758_8G175300 [Ceratodon purpureus]|nr:hypothetical protein M758_8G175300 [Ceratodon purpureus]